MRELLETLYNTGTQMNIVPFDDGILIKFYHNLSGKAATYMISAFDFGNTPFDMGEYIGLLLNKFFENIGVKATA